MHFHFSEYHTAVRSPRLSVPTASTKIGCMSDRFKISTYVCVAYTFLAFKYLMRPCLLVHSCLLRKDSTPFAATICHHDQLIVPTHQGHTYNCYHLAYASHHRFALISCIHGLLQKGTHTHTRTHTHTHTHTHTQAHVPIN